MNRKPKKVLSAREMAMPEVKKLVKEYGKTAIYGCLMKLSEIAREKAILKNIKLPKNFGKMK